MEPDVTGRADPVRVNLGYLHKALESTMSSYVDIVHPCKELRLATLRTPQVLDVDDIFAAASGNPDWDGCDNLESFVASLDGSQDSSGHIGLGIATYPFKLTSPNYDTNMSLNLSVELQNAFMLVTAQIGGERAQAVITPSESIQIPPDEIAPEIDLATIDARGLGTGKVSLDFSMLSRDEPEGTLAIAFVPNLYDDDLPIPTGLSYAKIKDNRDLNDTMSMSVNTWSVARWPAFNYARRYKDADAPCSKYLLPDNECGHNFEIRPRYNPWTPDASGEYLSGQISGECRQVAGDEEQGAVCEDWVILAHSPRPQATDDDDTATTLMDVVVPTTTVTATGGSTTTTTTVYSSAMDQLEDAGGALYAPGLPRLATATAAIAYSTTIAAAELVLSKTRTTGNWFEQVLFPRSFLSAYPNLFEVCINDGLPRYVNYPTSTAVSSNCGGTYTASSATTTVTWTVAVDPDVPSLPTSSSSTPTTPRYVDYTTRFVFLP